jgi:hypothetical protein
VLPFRAGIKEISFLSATSRPALGPIQPPVQKVLGTIFLRVMWMGCAADHLPPYSTKIKMERNCAITPPHDMHKDIL